MKNLFIYIISLISLCSNAQSESITHKKDRLWQTNFNGRIKTVKISYTEFHAYSKFIETLEPLIQNERAIIGVVNVKFDREGRIIWSSNVLDENQRKIKRNYNRFQYNEKDINYKNSLLKKSAETYPVFNDPLRIKLNTINISPNRYYEPNAIADYQKDSLKMYYVNYLYKTDNKQQIVEERYYSFFKEYHPAGDPTDLTYYTNLYTISYYYDNEGKLLKQKIFRGDGPGVNSRMYGVNDWSIPFHAMGTESGFCEDLHFSYQYDAKDRITDIVFFGCNDTLAKEHYSYDEKAGYVNKIRKYTGGIGGPVSVPKTVDLFYDEHANVIKREFIRSRYHTSFRFNDIPQTTYYKYDYDKYNNWIKCYIYYTGKPEGEPTAVVERKIEYYEE